MNWETYRPNIVRLSLFRWRLEWALLGLAAVSLVLGEQAREARARDPYQLLTHGLTAAAVVEELREEVVTTAVRRGEPVLEVRTFIDLTWFDERHERRRIVNYRLDQETVQGLRIDVMLKRWPAYVNVHYLDRAPPDIAPATDALQPMPIGVTAPSFQQSCNPAPHCRVVVLLPDTKSVAERDADFVDLMLGWAPFTLWLSLASIMGMLALRFFDVIDNKPSLE
jgi:hypothetical protein